jgi:hypothetical protein
MNEKELSKQIKKMGKEYIAVFESKQESLKTRKKERSFYLEECLLTQNVEDSAEVKQKLSISIVKYWMTTLVYMRNHSLSMHLLEAMAIEKNYLELKDEIDKYSKKVLEVEQFTDLWLCTYHFKVLEVIYLLESVNSFGLEEIQNFTLFLTDNEILDEEIDEEVMRRFLTPDQLKVLNVQLIDYYCDLIDLAVTKLSEIGSTVTDKSFVETFKNAITVLFDSCSKHSDSEMNLARERLIQLLRQ